MSSRGAQAGRIAADVRMNAANWLLFDWKHSNRSSRPSNPSFMDTKVFGTDTDNGLKQVELSAHHPEKSGRK
jgi:hypothetical protein